MLARKDGKLDSKVKKAIFMGFKSSIKGYKLWDPKDKKIVPSRDVTYNEASFMKPNNSKQVENKTKKRTKEVL